MAGTTDCKRIEPYKGFRGIGIRDLIKFREIFYIFVWRDLKIRYAQTFGGISWILMQPILSILIYTVFFGLIIKVPTEIGIPYPIYFFAGYLPWFLCSEALMRSNYSIIANSNIVTKVAFPKLLLPLASVTSPVIDFLTASGILVVLMLIFGYIPLWTIIAIPIVILLTVVTSFAIGIIACTINTKHRDVQNFMPYLIQMWSYASPVVYPVTLVPSYLLGVYLLNPMVVIIEIMRWAVLGTPFPPNGHFISIPIAVALCIIGLVLFKTKEHEFADFV